MIPIVSGLPGARAPGLGAGLEGLYLSAPHREAITFRNYVAWPAARKLLREGKPVELGGRAFDLLITLLRARGETVSKQEIVRQVWPTTIVEESNLRFQVATLRRALRPDSDLIMTVPGRGYVLVDEFEEMEDLICSSHTGNGTGPNGHGPSSEANAPGRASSSDPPRENDFLALIEPDAGMRDSLSSFFALQKIELRTFGSADEFLGSEAAANASCIISEIWLPGRTGLELQDELARRGLQVPVIFLTGHAEVHTVVSAMRAGAVDVLTKPIRHLELLAAVRLALRH